MNTLSRGTLGSWIRGNRFGRGFSLVEILISIIILGLGLLGLGALFPVVIRQQRISTDQTLGVIVGESARSKLGSGAYAASGTWRLLGTAPLPVPPPLPQGIGLATGYDWENPLSSGPQPYESGEWYLGPNSARLVLDNDIAVQRGLKRGAAWIGYPNDNTTWSAIPLSERLYPADSETPQFAWDFAVHRVTDGRHDSSPGNDAIRAAIFVRRIDQRIRVPKDQTLRDVLLADNGVPASDQRAPFGEDAAQEQPTLDGTDGAGGYRYSQIKSALVQFIHQPGVGPLEGRDRLYVPTTVQNNIFALMRQPNQRLVDNLGNIYTVISSGDDGALGRYLKIEPPVPASVTGRQDENAPNDRIAIREVAFTAHVPVYVTTLEVAK